MTDLERALLLLVAQCLSELDGRLPDCPMHQQVRALRELMREVRAEAPRVGAWAR